MGVSKHRKAHKAKYKARSSAILQRREYTLGLIAELEEQLKIVRDNPITGVDIDNQEMLRITGT